MKVLFVVGFGPIVPNMEISRRLYGETLGLPLDGDATYLHTEAIEGVKEFALWPLSGAAESCFGTTTWPADVPAPSAWMEFDVADIDEASRELQERGYRLLVAARREPWGQVVTRFLSPEGILIGVTVTPSMRDQDTGSAT
jgi:catechol 2,3-dioxygenase-like lactoylglutathione lyase family enzyme